MMHALAGRRASKEEVAELRRLINEYEGKHS
jgi:hypothetical protein